MKVNDYVRTKDGIIDKVIIDYNGHCNSPSCNCKHISCKYNYYDEDTIIKSSPNIIELFEEHDLVVIEYYSLRYKERVTRLFEVDYKDKEFMTLKNAHCDFMLRNNEFNDEDKKLKPIIKSIVTCEQFSQMEYKVGE